MVTVKANVDAASSTSQQDSAKQSTSYSKDVVSRAINRITQTTKQSQTMLTSSEYEEKLHHGFDNTNGPGNISGVYQWVNKVYEAQLYNYGQRLMFDVMVPEPAAFLISQMRKQVNDKVQIPPPPFVVLPQHVSDSPAGASYYQKLAAPYGTTNLDPPPDQSIVLSKEFDASGLAQNTTTTRSGESPSRPAMQQPLHIASAALKVATISYWRSVKTPGT